MFTRDETYEKVKVECLMILTGLLKMDLQFFLIVVIGVFFVQCQGVQRDVDKMENNKAPQLTESCISYREQARIFRLKGDREEARKQFENAIKTGCGEGEIRREMAEMYTWWNQFELAEEEYKKLLKLDDRDLRGHSALASLYIEKIHNYQLGVEELTKVDKLLTKKDYASRRGTDRLWGKAYDGLGNKTLAVKYYVKYLKESCSEIPDSSNCTEISSRVRQLR